jgi:hypothetical protein
MADSIATGDAAFFAAPKWPLGYACFGTTNVRSSPPLAKRKKQLLIGSNLPACRQRAPPSGARSNAVSFVAGKRGQAQPDESIGVGLDDMVG